MGLYQRVRPQNWDDVIGQDHVVNPLRKMIEEESLPELILLGGISGCLKGSSVIYDPVDGTSRTVADRWSEAAPFHVASLNTRNKLVIALALPPVRYPKQTIYRVCTKNSEFFVTGGHKLKTFYGGYEPLHVFLRRRQAFVDTPLLSIWGIDQLIPNGGVHNSMKTTQGCRSGYRLSSRSYDGLLPYVQETYRSRLPLQDDVHGHNLEQRWGAWGNGSERNHPRLSFCPPSKQDYVPLALTCVPQSEFPFVSKSNKLFLPKCQKLALSVFESSHLDTRSEPRSLDVDLSPYSSHGYRDDADTLLLASSMSPEETGLNFTEDRIEHIEAIGQEEFFDFHVPVWNNYWMDGLIHHNCGKTTIAHIIRKELGIKDPPNVNFHEVNAATEGGVDDARKIKNSMRTLPLGGKYKMYLIDECFPAGTLVKTPKGQKPIELVREGEAVCNLTGTEVVQRTFKNRVALRRLVRLHLSDGRKIVTTDSHRFLTKLGWVEASRLEGLYVLSLVGKVAIHQKEVYHADLSCLQKPVQVQGTQQVRVLLKEMWHHHESGEKGGWQEGKNEVQGVPQGVLSLPKGQEDVLFAELRRKEQNETPRVQGEIICQGGSREESRGVNSLPADRSGEGTRKTVLSKNVDGQPDSPRGCRQKNQGDEGAEWDRSPTDPKSGWQRSRVDGSTEDTTRSVAKAESRVGARVYSTDMGQKAEGRSADSLQDRYRSLANKNSHRNRRTESQIEEDFISRRTKSGEVVSVRVDRVEVYQQGDPTGSFQGVVSDQDRLRGFVIFYDMEVSNHPSYFVEGGIVVHNCHRGSDQFQQAFLIPTENTPKHVKFVFLTSEADKLIRPLQTRAHRFDLNPLSHDDLMELMRTVMSSEDIDVSKSVMEEITATCEGSARQALVLLEQAWAAKDEKEALEVVQRASPNRESVNFAQVLLKDKWPEAVTSIKSLEMEPERVRRGLMNYMASVLLNNPRNQKAARILKLFQFPFIHGKADLVLATYEFFHTPY